MGNRWPRRSEVSPSEGFLESRTYALCAYSCDGSPLPRIPPSGPRSYDHERIASFCARSATIGPEYESYESEWAASEVGEGVEEMWDRSVRPEAYWAFYLSETYRA